MARCRGRLVIGLAVLSLLLVACGEREEASTAQDEGPDLAPESEAPDDEDDAPAEDDEASADEDEGDENDENDESDENAGSDDEPAEEGEVREHRPPEEAEAFADCGSIDGADPGAVIRFPSEDVAGSLDAGDGPVTVEVVGCGNTFEANVQWEAYHGANSTPTLEGHTMGGTMGDWGAFSIAETYWTPGDWTVVVFEMDAESGDRVEYDEVTFTVGG